MREKKFEDAQGSPNFFVQLYFFFSSHAFLGTIALLAGMALLVLVPIIGNLPFFTLIALGSSTFLTLLFGAGFYKKAFWDFFKYHTLTTEVVLVLSTFVLIASSFASLFFPWLPMMMEASLCIFGARHLSLALEGQLKQHMTKIKNFSQELSQKDEQNKRLAWKKDMAMHALFEEKAPIEKSMRSYLPAFVPILMGLALIACGLSALFFSPALALQLAIVILVSAPPSSLSLIAPVTVQAGIKKSLQYDVWFKSKEALQSAAKIDVLVFSLSALTKEKMRCTRTIIKGREEEQAMVLSTVAALQRYSDNPFAIAMYKEIKNSGIPIQKLPRGSTLKAGLHANGIQAKVEDNTWIIGNLQMMRETAAIKNLHNWLKFEEKLKLKPTETAIYIVNNNVFLGYMVLEGVLRDDAEKMIETLKKSKKQIRLCTYRHERAALYYAQKLKIPKSDVLAFSQQNQEGKALSSAKNWRKDSIQALRNQGLKVALVDSSMDDAAALKAANLGIVLAAEGTLHKKQADEVPSLLKVNSLASISQALQLAKSTINSIHRGLFLVLGANMATMALFAGLLLCFGLVLHPGIGVAFGALQMLLIFTNVRCFQRKPIEMLKTSSYQNMHKTFAVGDGLDPRSSRESSLNSELSASRFSMSPLKKSPFSLVKNKSRSSEEKRRENLPSSSRSFS